MNGLQQAGSTPSHVIDECIQFDLACGYGQSVTSLTWQPLGKVGSRHRAILSKAGSTSFGSLAEESPPQLSTDLSVPSTVHRPQMYIASVYLVWARLRLIEDLLPASMMAALPQAAEREPKSQSAVRIVTLCNGSSGSNPAFRNYLLKGCLMSLAMVTVPIKSNIASDESSGSRRLNHTPGSALNGVRDTDPLNLPVLSDTSVSREATVRIGCPVLFLRKFPDPYVKTNPVYREGLPPGSFMRRSSTDQCSVPGPPYQ